MTTRDTTTSKSALLPVLLALIVLCLAGAAVLTLMTQTSPPLVAPNEQLSFVVQRMPFEAQNALRGEMSAFDALAASAARMKGLRGALTDTKTAANPAWDKVSEAAATVEAARAAVETIRVSNQEARDVAPKLLSELGDFASA